MDISYEKNNEGAWRLTAIVGNHYFTKVYYFYTKKEATDLFKEFVGVMTTRNSGDLSNANVGIFRASEKGKNERV